MHRHTRPSPSRPPPSQTPIERPQPVAPSGKGILYRNLQYIDTQPRLETDDSTTIEGLLDEKYVEITKAALSKRSVIFTDRTPKYPMLSHGLDKVLRNYGLHRMKDADGTLQFPEVLARCPQPEEVDHESFPKFITSSKDKVRSRFKLWAGSTPNLQPGIYFHPSSLRFRLKYAFCKVLRIFQFQENSSSASENFSAAALSSSLALHCDPIRIGFAITNMLVSDAPLSRSQAGSEIQGFDIIGLRYHVTLLFSLKPI